MTVSPAMTGHHDTTTARPGVVYTILALSIVVSSAVMLMAMIVLWLGQASEHVYANGADAFTIRAVLRPDTDAVAAEKLVNRIYLKIPNASVEIIDEAMGRSLLALQEPWIAQMPDFQVTPLPTLIEIHHPDLLTNPPEVAEFVKELGKEPSVDFVSYNETAHDRLVKMASSTARIENHSMGWLLAALVLAGFAGLLATALIKPAITLPGVLTRIITVWVPAWFVSWLLYRGWESTAIQTGQWERLNLHGHIIVGLVSLVAIATANVIGFIFVRIRP